MVQPDTSEADVAIATEPTDGILRRLKSDDRIKALRLRERGHGLSDGQFNWLMQQVAAIPRAWLLYRRENVSQGEKRRAEVKKKAQELALLLRQDHETRCIRIGPNGETIEVHDGLLSVPYFAAMPTAAEFILRVIDDAFCVPITDWRMHHPAHRPALKSFAVHTIFDTLQNWLPWLRVISPGDVAVFMGEDGGGIPHEKAQELYLRLRRSRSPNKEVAVLVSALIGRSVTAQQVTQIRKDERRSYYSEDS